MADIKRILTPMDFSDGSELAADRAADLAKQLGAELVLMHVLDDMPLASGDVGHPPALTPDAYEQSAREKLVAYARKLEASGINVKIELARGEAAEVVVEHAKAAADMIVMSTHGRTGVARVLFGSVAERVIRSATVPVMTVRT